MFLSLLKAFNVYILQIIILFLLERSNCSLFTENSNKTISLQYSAPQFDINFANVTFGSARFNSKANPESTFIGLGQTIANVCQADLINRNKTQFSVNGLINLIYQDYDIVPTSGQGAIVNILTNDLKEDAGILENFRKYSANITGIIGLYDYGSAKINSLVTNDFGIPTVSAGDLARSNLDDRFSGFFPAQDATLFLILGTFEYNTFNAVLDILNHFNWTMVGNIFDSNNYGYQRQMDVADYSSSKSETLFACQVLFYFDINTNTDERMDLFCKCVTEKSTIQVIVLWMGTSAAVSAILHLRKRCSAAENWTFIVTDDFQTPFSYANQEVLKNSLLLRTNGPWSVANFIDNCMDGASPATSSLVQELIDDYTQTGYNCSPTNDGSLQECTSLYRNQNMRCFCPKKLLASDPYISRFLFDADVVSTYAEGIRLLANNCTYLNEKTEFDKLVRKIVPDFCKLTAFTPEILSLAMRYVNFTGYTGEIFFAQSTLTRSIKNLYLYSAYTNNIDAVLVGILNSTSVLINDTAIQFVNGQVPTSEIVPQNPDLSYAIVVVFFSLAIAEIIVCLAIIVYFIAHRKNLSMRKTSPLVTLMMTAGLLILASAQFFQSFARTDFFCTFQLYVYHTGFILIISGTLVKTYRVYRIFSNRTASALKITEASLLLIAGIISGVLILGITIFIAVFGIDAVVKQSSTNKYYQFVACELPNKTWNMIFIFFVRFYALIVLLIALVFTWLTRNIRSDYRETKALTAFAYTVLSAYIILLPLIQILGDETDSAILKYTIEMEFYLLLILAALGLLFLPKVYNIYWENKRKASIQSNINYIN